MPAAPLPENESERLAALASYNMLDTLPEQAYDDITAIAATLCNTPIALITLVDEDRQWFKSKVGLSASQTPRDQAFCAHTIHEPAKVMVVPDARLDPRFADNPLVIGVPDIRFYAGAPLVTSDGHALGTICVIDRKPGSLTDAQCALLLALARQVISQMELRRNMLQMRRTCDDLNNLCASLESQAEVMARDLRRAERIQQSLLPAQPPALDGMCLQTLYRPGNTIGGDLFDAMLTGPDTLVLVLADAAGHGISAAMLSLLFRNRLQQVLADGTAAGAAALLAQVNAKLADDLAAPGMFVTAVVALVNTASRTVDLASAGHGPVLHQSATGEVTTLAHTGPALGLYASATYRAHQLTLAAQDSLFLHTDGLIDSASPETASTGHLAAAIGRLPLDGKLEDVLLELCQGSEPADRDDVTMLLLRAQPGPSHFDEATVQLPTRAEAEGNSAELLYAETLPTTFLVLRGKVTWIHAHALLRAASNVIDARRTLVLDLAGCDHLDSTMLGTLHELVVLANTAGVTLLVQGVRPAVLDAFQELSLDLVLAHLATEAMAVPDTLSTVALPVTDAQQQQQRLLRAHELLSELSDANQATFASVVDAMREDDAGLTSVPP